MRQVVATLHRHSSSRCAGLSPSQPLLLRSTGSRRAGSAIVAHVPSRSAACGIFPDQGSNPCSLHWQAVSQPLRHLGSPPPHLFFKLPGDSGLQAGWCTPGTSGAASASPVSPWMPSFLHLGVSMQGLSWVGLKPILTSTALCACCLLVALSLGSDCGHTP